MFMCSEVTTGQEVTPSHLCACLLGPAPSMLRSVPKPCPLRGFRGLRGSKSYSLYLLLSRGGP